MTKFKVVPYSPVLKKNSIASIIRKENEKAHKNKNCKTVKYVEPIMTLEDLESGNLDNKTVTINTSKIDNQPVINTTNTANTINTTNTTNTMNTTNTTNTTNATNTNNNVIIINDTQNKIWSFKTRTQTDSYYLMFKQKESSVLGYAAPFYVMMMAKRFMDESNILFVPTKENHEDILDSSVLTAFLCDIEKVMDLNILLKILNEENGGKDNIIKKDTNVNAISTNRKILEDIILVPDEKTKRVVTFIYKNANIFLILAECDREKNIKYYVRNPHISTQYNFCERSDLIKHLSDTYSFDKQFAIDGYVITDYSNIQYATYTKSFQHDPNFFLSPGVMHFAFNGDNNIKSINVTTSSNNNKTIITDEDRVTTKYENGVKYNYFERTKNGVTYTYRKRIDEDIKERNPFVKHDDYATYSDYLDYMDGKEYARVKKNMSLNKPDSFRDWRDVAYINMLEDERMRKEQEEKELQKAQLEFENMFPSSKMSSNSNGITNNRSTLERAIDQL